MNKEQLLSKANILLISDNEDDLKELEEYGFKNIAYFKSIIIANNYFEEHPEELAKFHFVIKGRQLVQRVCFGGNTELDNRLHKLPHEVAELYIYDDEDYCYYLDNNRLRSNDMCSVLNYYTKQVLKDKNIQNIIMNSELISIEEPILPPIIYPKSKKDLKILMLLSGIVYTSDEKSINRSVGIDVHVEGDNNYGLGNFVIRNMGDYDIIIASKCYSRNLLDMNGEYTEQGKLSGKGLGVVAIYEDNSIFNQTSDGNFTFNYIGTELIVNSAFGGLNATDTNTLEENYKVESENRVKLVTSIIEKSIIKYHEALKKINGVGLVDVVPEEFNRYNAEYEKANAQYEQDKRDYAEQVEIYDNILREAKRYLSNKKKGRIKTPLVDLIIEEKANGISIENYVGKRKICSLTLSLNDENKNRVFFIQTIKDNGQPTGDCEVALYPIEKNFNIARPNAKQLSALNGVWKKIERNLVPINADCAERLKLTKQSKNRESRNKHHKNY